MNEPAFPVPSVLNSNGDPIVGTQGMSLRDYFAAKAMQSMYQIHYNMFLEGTFEDWQTEGMLSMAEAAYCMADAMMKEREK